MTPDSAGIYMDISYKNKDNETLEYGIDNWNPDAPDWTIYLEISYQYPEDYPKLITFDSVEDMEEFYANIGKMIEKVKELRNK